MLVLSCFYCGSKHIRMLMNEDGYAKFKCDVCWKRWGMNFEMVEIEAEDEEEIKNCEHCIKEIDNAIE